MYRSGIEKPKIVLIDAGVLLSSKSTREAIEACKNSRVDERITKCNFKLPLPISKRKKRKVVLMKFSGFVFGCPIEEIIRKAEKKGLIAPTPIDAIDFGEQLCKIEYGIVIFLHRPIIDDSKPPYYTKSVIYVYNQELSLTELTPNWCNYGGSDCFGFIQEI
ncbi:MAG TPA: hypothetical protein P5232_02095 [Candidatus Moranbacteria bacterium]|nr:hypothetical protein [Candidatus Moranbacteria bacterium]